jgi:hypothetical protein
MWYILFNDHRQRQQARTKILIRPAEEYHKNIFSMKKVFDNARVKDFFDDQKSTLTI